MFILSKFCKQTKSFLCFLHRAQYFSQKMYSCMCTNQFIHSGDGRLEKKATSGFSVAVRIVSYVKIVLKKHNKRIVG